MGFAEEKHPRGEHGKFTDVGGATHTGKATQAARQASKDVAKSAPKGHASVDDHHAHAAAHIKAATAHITAADISRKAAAKEPDPARRSQHQANAAAHEQQATEHAKQSSGAMTKAGEAHAKEGGIGAWVNRKLGVEGRKDVKEGKEALHKGEKEGKALVVKAAEAFHSAMGTLGEGGVKVAEQLIEGNPLALGRGLLVGGAAVIAAGAHKALGIEKKEKEEHERGEHPGLASGHKQEKFGGEFERLSTREGHGGEGGDFYDAEQDDEDVEA